MQTRAWAVKLSAFLLLLASCSQPVPPTPVTIRETVVVTEILGDQIVEVVVTSTPAPTATATGTPIPFPRTLAVCMGAEPDTLYLNGGAMLVASHVLEMIYDGPIDSRAYDYQAIILEKLPNLADGDAVIRQVAVAAGDTIVDAGGEPVALEPDVVYRPAGCRSDDCAQTYSADDGSVLLDQMTVTFKLLPGLLWSDGEPLTAADSVYHWTLDGNPNTPGSFGVNLRPLSESYEALDDLTTRWVGVPGYLDQTYFLNFWHPLPEHAWGQYTADELLELDEARSTPMGWGPYVIDEWEIGSHITLSRNPHYFRADEGLPKFDRVILRIMGEDANLNIASLLSGECDFVEQDASIEQEIDMLLDLESQGVLQAVIVPGATFEHADFGILPACFDSGGWAECIAEGRPDYFGDVRTRRAITMCMDRQAVVETVLYGRSIILDTYLPPEHPLFNADVASYPFDPATGSALLEQAGWTLDGSQDGVRIYTGDNSDIPAGTRLSFNYWTTNATQRRQATQILAASLQECGIEALPELWAPGDFFADGPDGPLFGRRFEIGQFAWLTGAAPPCDLWLTEQIPGEDPERYPSTWDGSNITGYSNAAYDAACRGALAALPGEPGYLEHHQLAQAIFAEDLPVIPLYLRLKFTAARTDLCGFIVDSTQNSEFWNVEAFERCP